MKRWRSIFDSAFYKFILQAMDQEIINRYRYNRVPFSHHVVEEDETYEKKNMLGKAFSLSVMEVLQLVMLHRIFQSSQRRKRASSNVGPVHTYTRTHIHTHKSRTSLIINQVALFRPA